ncbi:MAG: NAD(P)-dependent oxidoreductase, partial [Burkholderiales bacterium]
GFIGLGVMGQAMVANLMRGGHEMNVFARKPETLEGLISAGAVAHSTAHELAAASEVVFIMVTTTADVEQVLFSDNGVVDGAKPGTIVVVMSTIAPKPAREFAARLQAKGIEMLDAPVSGGPTNARAANLSIMVGGKSEIFDRVEPLFECLGKTIVYIGESGAGMITKACNQLCVVANMQAVAEAVVFARANGVDAGRVLQALVKGFAGSTMLEAMGSRMVSRNFEPGVEARLHHKDVGIVLECARDSGLALPVAALAAQSFNALMTRGGEKRDSSSVITVVERDTNQPTV